MKNKQMKNKQNIVKNLRGLLSVYSARIDDLKDEIERLKVSNATKQTVIDEWNEEGKKWRQKCLSLQSLHAIIRHACEEAHQINSPKSR